MPSAVKVFEATCVARQRNLLNIFPPNLTWKSRKFASPPGLFTFIAPVLGASHGDLLHVFSDGRKKRYLFTKRSTNIFELFLTHFGDVPFGAPAFARHDRGRRGWEFFRCGSRVRVAQQAPSKRGSRKRIRGQLFQRQHAASESFSILCITIWRLLRSPAWVLN